MFCMLGSAMSCDAMFMRAGLASRPDRSGTPPPPDRAPVRPASPPPLPTAVEGQYDAVK